MAWHSLAGLIYLGIGGWTLPIVLLLNGHLRTVELPEVALSLDFEEDTNIFVEQRKVNTEQIWIGGEEYTWDSREDVRMQLLQYARAHRMNTAVPVPDGAPPPAESSEEAEPATKRPRRSIDDL